jgi:2-polyprenyl-6-methoxyphenol hydroxylase-like FAD-dependent oxidoreductase
LADAEELALCIAQREYWREVGDLKVLRRYERRRAGPTQAMAWGCDTLQILFGLSHPVLQKMRQWGMSSLNRIHPLKRELVRFASG